MALRDTLVGFAFFFDFAITPLHYIEMNTTYFLLPSAFFHDYYIVDTLLSFSSLLLFVLFLHNIENRHVFLLSSFMLNIVTHIRRCLSFQSDAPFVVIIAAYSFFAFSAETLPPPAVSADMLRYGAPRRGGAQAAGRCSRAV